MTPVRFPLLQRLALLEEEIVLLSPWTVAGRREI